MLFSIFIYKSEMDFLSIIIGIIIIIIIIIIITIYKEYNEAHNITMQIAPYLC